MYVYDSSTSPIIVVMLIRKCKIKGRKNTAQQNFSKISKEMQVYLLVTNQIFQNLVHAHIQAARHVSIPSQNMLLGGKWGQHADRKKGNDEVNEASGVGVLATAAVVDSLYALGLRT